MKTIASIILLVLIASPTLINTAVLVDYALRYQVYVEKLCENKEEPPLKCNGKCQLAKSQQNPEVPSQVELVNLEVLATLPQQDISLKTFSIYFEKSALLTKPLSISQIALEIQLPPPKL